MSNAPDMSLASSSRTAALGWALGEVRVEAGSVIGDVGRVRVLQLLEASMNGRG
jgi:hypothetical protein